MATDPVAGSPTRSSLDRLSDGWIALIFLAVSVAVFSSGFSGGFIDDDVQQIVNNPFVHSLANISVLFQGGTAYTGPGLAGNFYRPLQSVVYALLYTFFGGTPLYFHLLQTLVVGASAFMVFKVFTYFFARGLSLLLALLFLVHPLNSQMVFAIPKLGDALCFFFGIFALWLILRYRSERVLVSVAGCLLLAFLAKENGPVILMMLLIYMALFQRKRLYGWALPIFALPSVIYLLLKAGATGLTVAVLTAPVDYVSVGSRMLTMPSMIAFYISKFVFPWQLASAYYWVEPQFTFKGFVVPLIVDLLVAGLLIYVALRLRRVAGPWFPYFLFFAAWTVFELAPYLQVVPLDMTASETWFYSPMFGVLGMAGVVLSAFGRRLPLVRRLDSRAMTALAVVLLPVLAGRTYTRGMDWSSAYSLAATDVTASPGNFHAEQDLSYEFIKQGKYAEAVTAAQAAVGEFPSADTYEFLGTALLENQQYQLGKDALLTALQSQVLSSPQRTEQIYQLLGSATAYDTTGFDADRTLLLTAVNLFPSNGVLWFDLAIIDENLGNRAETQAAAANAFNLGAIDSTTYNNLVNRVHFSFPPHPPLSGQ